MKREFTFRIDSVKSLKEKLKAIATLCGYVKNDYNLFEVTVSGTFFIDEADNELWVNFNDGNMVTGYANKRIWIYVPEEKGGCWASLNSDYDLPKVKVTVTSIDRLGIREY